MEQDEFKVKILIDESLSVDMLMKTEMRIEEFDALIEKAKRISKASGYAYEAISGIKTGKSNKHWTEEEIESLKKDYPVMDRKEIEQKYGRNYSAIYNKAAINLGLVKVKNKRVFSGNEEDEIAKMMKNHVPVKAMAERINKTPMQIKNKIKYMRERGLL